MTTVSEIATPTPGPSFAAAARNDHRGSWIPTWSMVTTRFMELRRRRGLMIALIAVNIGIPTVFLAVRLISHAVDPKSYGPAGGYSIFTSLVAGVMYVFGFIVAAVVGCTAGSVDLTEGMFRHLVISGRSRVALYLARIPAGLAIVIAMVAIGYTIVCGVCSFAAPTQLNYDGVIVPQGLSRAALDNWAASHADKVICNFNFHGGVGLNGPPPNGVGRPPGSMWAMATPTMPRSTFTRCVITWRLKIGVRISSNTIRRMTGTVRCPISDASPRPTMNPIVASSATHRPTSIINEVGGTVKLAL